MSLALSLIAPVPIPPHLLADSQVIAAAIIFAVSYLVFALGKLPGMKIDRPGMAIIGAVLMVAFGIVRADQALRFIDFGTLVLLFSMMLVVGCLHLAGFFEWVTEQIVVRLKPRRQATLQSNCIAKPRHHAAFCCNRDQVLRTADLRHRCRHLRR